MSHTIKLASIVIALTILAAALAPTGILTAPHKSVAILIEAGSAQITDGTSNTRNRSGDTLFDEARAEWAV